MHHGVLVVDGQDTAETERRRLALHFHQALAVAVQIGGDLGQGTVSVDQAAGAPGESLSLGGSCMSGLVPQLLTACPISPYKYMWIG